MVKFLPQLAKEQASLVHSNVKEQFDDYEREVSQRMNDDTEARKAELENLLTQKESREINRDAEVKRLKILDDNILAQWNSLESAYENLLGAKT